MDSSPSNPPATPNSNSAENKNTINNINNNSAPAAGETNGGRTFKKIADSDLKISIIKFMKERPFLWNNKHSHYKDHKRRDQEFKAFSERIGYPVQEIKRVWHVLRTNFFRAHKLLMERPQSGGENGEKLWKYYLAMEYILEGTIAEDSGETRQTRSYRNYRTARVQKDPITDNTDKNDTNNNNNAKNPSNISGSSSSNSCCNNSMNNKTTLSNESSMDSDDEQLYVRSMTSTLKRFDPTTKEIIKLKFQEIIVNYMQQQQSQSK